jgi:hypothetical protein
LTFAIAVGCEEVQAARKPAARVTARTAVALRRRERAEESMVKIVP